nr:HAD family hydrolase [uncultured Faecalibacillus sp.]
MKIYFDLDDTLYRLYDPFYKAYQEVFLKEIDIYQLWKKSRIYNNEIYSQYLNKQITKDELAIYRLKKAFKDFNIDISNQQALKFQKVYEYQQAHISLSSIMKEVFTYLKEKKVTYGILTNGKEQAQISKIKSLFEIIDFPVIISNKVGYQKPQKEIFDLIKDEETYYVGDGYEIDMIGASQAGIKTIWYNHQHLKKDTSFIDYVVYSDEELLNVIKKLNND